jgi:tRNA-dihydrouridine synthase
MRKHFVAYTRGMQGTAPLRQAIMRAEGVSEYERLTEEYLRSAVSRDPVLRTGG